MLANKLLGDLTKRYKRDSARLSQNALLALEAYDWPGNIRQLFNALEYALVHADGPEILPAHLPPEIEGSARAAAAAATDASPLVRPYYRPVRQAQTEAEVISRILAEAGGNKAEAARRLGMSRTTLWKRLKQAER